MPWQLLILRSFFRVKLRQSDHTTFRVVLAQVVSLPLCFDKGAELCAEADAGVSTSFRWAGVSQLSGFCWQADSSGTKRCIAMCWGHVCKFFFTVRRTRHVLQWHLRIWCNCTVPSVATQVHNIHCLYFCPDFLFSLCYPHQHHYFTRALLQYF